MGRERALNVKESAFGRKLGGTAENFVPCICVQDCIAYARDFLCEGIRQAESNHHN